MNYRLIFILFLLAVTPSFSLPQRVYQDLNVDVNLYVNRSTFVNNGTTIIGGGIYNSTNGFTGNVSIGASSPLSILNISGSPNNTITLTFDNTSYANIDTRQRADNQSVARLDRTNTFLFGQFIIGGINVTTFVNATEIWATRINASIDCKYITGSDADFCNDAQGGGTGTYNSTNNFAGNVSIGGQHPLSIVNISGSPNNTLTITFNNASYANLDIRQLADNTTLTNLINQFTKSVNGITGNITLRGTQYINITGNSTDIVFSWDNYTLSNLDVRERSNNQTQSNQIDGLNGTITALSTRYDSNNVSVARTDRSNTFNGNQFIIGDFNVTGSINATQYLGNLSNATFPVSNLSCTGNVVENITLLRSGLLQIQCKSASGASGVSTVNTIGGSVLLRGTSMINITGNSTDIVFSYVNVSLENLDIRERANNQTQSNQIDGLNGTITALSTRYDSNNVSVARTDRNNIFTGTQFFTNINVSNHINVTNITSIIEFINMNLTGFNGTSLDYKLWINGGINVTGIINATNITVNNNFTSLVPLSIPERSILSGAINSLDQNKLSITLPFANITGFTGVTSINTLTGAVILRGSSMINITGNSSDILFTFNNESLTQLDSRVRLFNTSATSSDTRQQADNITLTNLINTFTRSVNGIDGNATLRGSSMINITGNSTFVHFSFKNDSLDNLDTRQRADNTTLTNLINQFTKSVNGIIGNITLRGTSMINITGNSTDIVFSYVNVSLENLDTRQRADNQSIVRTNRDNFITGGINVTTFINATVSQVVNVTINSTGTYWLQGTTCRNRQYWNGTFFVVTGIC